MAEDKRVPLVSATGSTRMGKSVGAAVGARSGRVLKQEAIVLGARLTFLRCSDSAAESLATRVLENAPPDPDVGSTLGPEQNLLPKAILQ